MKYGQRPNAKDPRTAKEPRTWIPTRPQRSSGRGLRIALWFLPGYLVAAGAILLFHPELDVSTSLLLALDTIFLVIIPGIVGTFALSSFLADGFLPILLLGAGVLSQAVASLLAFGLRISPAEAPMSETVFDSGLWLAGYFHVANVIACISGGAGIQGRARKWTTVGVGAVAVAALLVISASLTRGSPRLGIPGLPANPFALRFVLLTSAFPFVAAAIGAWSLRSLTSRIFLGWYALALAMIALGRATEMLTGAPADSLHLLARIGYYTSSAFLLAAIIQTEGAYRGLGVPISESLTRFLHDKGITHQSLVEVSTVAMIALEPDGSIRYWNPTAHELLRLKDRTGVNLADLADTPEERDRLSAGIAAMLRPAVRAGPISRFEAPLRGAGDRVFPAEISLLARRSDLGIDVALVEDVTERKVTELALERTSADLRRRAQLLQELTLELTQAEEREHRRLSLLLHDHLQQLLVATKINLAEYLQRESGTKSQLVYTALGRVEEAIEASRSLAVEISPPVLQNGLCPALEWLRESKRRKYGLQVDVEIDTEVEPEPPIRDLLFQAVRELLFNVVKHAQTDRASVRLSAEGENGIMIEVSDDGVGCDSERIMRKQPGEGGFGLFSIAQRLEAIGGRLTVECPPSGGTRLTLHAPARRDIAAVPHAAEPHRLRPARIPALIGDGAMGWKTDAVRILIADSHDIVDAELLEILDHQSDCEIVGETDGAHETLVVAARLHPEIVLLDASLERRLGGMQVARDLQALLPDVAVIGLTARDDSTARRGMRVAGAFACLARERAREELLPAVHAAAAAARSRHTEAPPEKAEATPEGAASPDTRS